MPRGTAPSPVDAAPGPELAPGTRPAPGAEPLVFTKTVKKKPRIFEPPQPLAPIVDTHAHLTCLRGLTPTKALVRAARAGVAGLVTLWDPIADGFDTFEAYRAWLDEVLATARAEAEVQGLPATLLDNVRFLAGVHPYGASEFTADTLNELRRALEDPRCAGIGEIGLDYHFDADDDIEAAPHDVQIACATQQLELARAHGVPVELHVRNDAGDASRCAHTDMWQVLHDAGVPEAGCVLHCFTEDRPCAEHFLELGCLIAFGGAATFKRNVEMREAFAACPEDRILFETDCPYMAPEPIRGLPCEPAMVAFTVDTLIRDRVARTGEDPTRLALAATANAQRLFGLSLS